MNIDDLLKLDFVRSLSGRVCVEPHVLIQRPSAYFLKSEQESERYIERLIFLPPRGFTSNEINQTNCFEGVEKAVIEVIGAAKKDRSGFSRIKNCLLFVSFNKSAPISRLDRPYLEFNIKDLGERFNNSLHSSGAPPFHVVKVDGFGFYHTLINFSNEWLVLKVNKTMRPQKQPDLSAHLSTMQDEHVRIVSALHKGIVTHGDMIFDQDAALVQAVLSVPFFIMLPVLGEMLYIRDTGRHETCTAFALILKIGRKYPDQTIQYLNDALDNKSIPDYFGSQLIQKIRRYSEVDEPLISLKRLNQR